MKTIKLTRGSQPKLSTVASDTNTEADIVVAVELSIASNLHSAQSSYILKNTATPTIETQMKKSEMTRRTFLPNFSMMRVVRKVPPTWIAPTSIALMQESISLPEL